MDDPSNSPPEPRPGHTNHRVVRLVCDINPVRVGADGAGRTKEPGPRPRPHQPGQNGLDRVDSSQPSGCYSVCLHPPLPQ